MANPIPFAIAPYGSPTPPPGSIPIAIFGNATTGQPGLVKSAPPQDDSVAADVATLKADFNALLAKLRFSGVLSNAVIG